MSAYNSDPDLVDIIQDMQRRLGALERTRTLPVSSSAMVAGSAPDGAMQGQRGATKRLWIILDGVPVSVIVS